MAITVLAITILAITISYLEPVGDADADLI
jgi:hypothetical protein